MIRDIWEFPGRSIGVQVVVYSATDSTNTRAAEHAGQPGLAFLADQQAAGRGQYGRTWVARPGSSVLLSVLLAPSPSIRRPALLTAWAAVAVCETIRQLTFMQPRIKWPNDVLVDRRKVAGILIEQIPGGEVVAGIGLNVRQTAEEFTKAGLPDATSLLIAGADRPTEEVARLLLRTLDEEYVHLSAGEVVPLEARWKAHLGLLGRQVEVETAEGTERGRLLDVGFEGIVLEGSFGEIQFAPEAVRHLVELAGDAGPGGG